MSRAKPTTILGLLASAMITGCASTYVQPSSGPTSQIRFHLLNAEVFAMVHTYEKPNCVGPQYIGIIGGPQYIQAEKIPDRVRPQMYGSKKSPDPQILEVAVRAEKPFTVLYYQIGPTSLSGGTINATNCKLPITFLPLPDKQYEVRYQYHGTKCSAEVLQLSLNNRGGVETSRVDGVVVETANCTPSPMHN